MVTREALPGLRLANFGGPIFQPFSGLKTLKNKKRPVQTGLLSTARLASAGAVRKRLKKTHYFQVGNRCLCPKVLSM